MTTTATAPDHVHSDTCWAHTSGCGCGSTATGSCNPTWDAECPDNLSVPPAPLRLVPEPSPATDGEPPDLSHDWLVAATVKVDQKTAKHAAFRGSFRTQLNQRVDALDVYCGGCRRPYDDVADQPCSAKENNEHLIGGDPGVRKKRLIPELPSDAVIIRGPSIQRQGIAALMGTGRD